MSNSTDIYGVWDLIKSSEKLDKTLVNSIQKIVIEDGVSEKPSCTIRSK